MSSNGQDILIVGAGVIGLSLGRRLLKAGASVTIVERGETGTSGASRAAGGMLAPTAEVRFEETPLLEIGRKSLAAYPAFVAELEDEAGIDVDYQRQGTLVVGIDRDDGEALDHMHGYHQELNLAVDRLSAAEAHELEPGLSPNIHHALYCPDDHQIDPRLLLEALKIAFLRLGGLLVEHTQVTEVAHADGEISGVMTNTGEIIKASRVVICAGAWSRSIQGIPKEERPAVRPVRGQMLAIDLGSPPLCRHVIRAPDAYLIPKSNRQLLIGSTMEEVGFDERLTAGGVFELLRGAWEALPGITESAMIGMWTGFRPVSLDNLPVMGPSTVVEGLWYCTGHGRGGILLTPWTAASMADALEHNEPIVDGFAMSPTRFQR